MVITHRNIKHCILVGDGMVGKTYLVRRFVGKKLSQNYVTTVAEESSGFVTALGEEHELNITDFAGEYNELGTVPSSSNELDAVVVCYNTTDRDSFNNIKELWLPAIKNFFRKHPIILVATQTDLRNKLNFDHVKYSEGFELRKQIRAETFIECSALENRGVKELFHAVVSNIVRHRKRKSKIVNKIFGV